MSDSLYLQKYKDPSHIINKHFDGLSYRFDKYFSNKNTSPIIAIEISKYKDDIIQLERSLDIDHCLVQYCLSCAFNNPDNIAVRVLYVRGISYIRKDYVASITEEIRKSNSNKATLFTLIAASFSDVRI